MSGMNQTPSGERIHIGVFGRRNAGKSSLVNALTGQDLSVVSDVKGTTTDLVRKAMELLPLGPVVLIDTPGFDDEGVLGEKRVARARKAIKECDAALLVVDAAEGMTAFEIELQSLLRQHGVPWVVVFNKADLVEAAAVLRPLPQEPQCGSPAGGRNTPPALHVSALTGEGLPELKEVLSHILPPTQEKLRLVADLIDPGDFVVLVTPIDKAAPKGRLILPQQQAIRDILEADATAIVVKEHELRDTLNALGKTPSLVITDSQVFAKVSADVPRFVPLTSFSILFARYKGYLQSAVTAAEALDTLPDGAVILIAEGCTHHRQCDDIGTVKLPRWIRAYTGKSFSFRTVSGWDFPEDLSDVALVLHCGGCMLNDKAIKARQAIALSQGVPFANYGVMIAQLQGILPRCLEAFNR
ncbi:MAG: [FeFe] hydrogenase H-cluster maturation GTPase HydF [Oscillospiraceae bacterium]|nr:[FeFe] hydrogenase H-cluster maturation GTPase HydF [Oscillospiraceae bacterium]